MKIVCRARKDPSCYHGHECTSVYGEDTMANDGTFDGESVICDACYIAIGQPALPVESLPTREQVIEHVNHALEADES